MEHMQNKFNKILKNYSGKLDKELFKVEKENLGKYGFGIKGFILLVIETSIKV